METIQHGLAEARGEYIYEREEEEDEYNSYSDHESNDPEAVEMTVAPQFNLPLRPVREYEYEREEDDGHNNNSGDDVDEGDKVQEDEDSDIDADIDRAHAPTTTSEKRRAQNEIFRAFAAKRAEEVTEAEITDAIRETNEDRLSIRDMLAQEGNSSRITNPRDYQTELFQRAKEENIIAVLDTGSGKTHIATLLLRHILDCELEARAKGARLKVAFFLVNSVNLVFQQANVLRCGLDQKVEGICGAMGPSLWAKATWDKQFANNMVIVCTAEVLVQCLMHSFISISMINLLIFDEAHHTKSNHPYARLIKDYYLHEPDVAKRPRIFGMTASPVDANVDVRQAAMELETLLHCKIATTSDLSLLANHITRPEEEIARYSPLLKPFETPFHQELRSRYGHVQAFQKLFHDSKFFSSELGPWASDVYWSFAFSEDESRKIQLREERVHHRKETKSVEELDKEIKELQEAAEYVKDHNFGAPNLADLSSKVAVLNNYLQGYYERTADSRCIVFVERRQTARLLSIIFKYLGGPNLHGEILVGNGTTVGDQKVSVRTQFLTIKKFRKGELNCLFATSVAEEGLDIPQCNLVVRFDLYKTMIGYVQSRGRARHRNSKYLHMVEMGNPAHQSLVANSKNSEQIMRNFCNGLSSDRIINEIDDSVLQYLAEDLGSRSYTDPISGAKLSYRSSLAVLGHFVACLPTINHDVSLQPSYVVSHQGGKFICEVILPDCSPIISMMGRPCRRKVVARCSAAFEVCMELRRRGLLDENLLSTQKKSLPAMRNALLAITSKKKDLYDMRIKPEYWQLSFGAVPQRLYLTVVDLSAGLERPHQPLGLITRAPFPQMPDFPIYLVDGQTSNVITIPLNNAFPATEDRLNQFTTLTLQVYEDIFAKTFEIDIPKMSYWLVPLLADRTASVTSLDDPELLIDWDQVHEICEKREYRWTPEMTHDFLANKYIVDINDGGRRFYSVGVIPYLKARSPVPGQAPKYKHKKNILDYSISLWKKTRDNLESVWDESQPVIEVEKIPFRRNFLAHVEKDEEEVRWNPRAFVCPQPLRISALTTRFVAMCYVFPAIIHRYEAYMVALDGASCLGLNIGPRLALEAVTKDSDNTEDHGEEQIKYKSGMGPNYERLEFMGDCFLKMATTISTFILKADELEFEMHVRRMCMLCNSNLLNNGAKPHSLWEYVRSMAFSRRTWYPEGLKMIKGKGANKIGPQVIKHRLGDKTIADVCEAFIGAAFLEHNDNSKWEPQNWDEAVKAVKVLVGSEDHTMEEFADYYRAYKKPKWQTEQATASQLDLAKKIEQKHPYHFKYPRLLRCAFVHPSQPFSWELVPNYQRLEFLGDALLDQVFVTNMFYHHPDKDPQWLTEHKMPMVSNKFLGALCVTLGFHTHMRQNNAMELAQLRDYVTEIQEAERDADGAVDYWMGTSDPPKCLADIVEAFVAALFIDSEFDFTVVQTFFDMHIKRFFVDMTLYDKFAGNHPVTRLTKLLNIGFGCREFRIATASQDSVLPGKPTIISMVMIHNNVCFHYLSDSRRYGREKVCKKGLEKLDGLPPYEFRRLYGCDCEGGAGALDGDSQSQEALEKMVQDAVDGAN